MCSWSPWIYKFKTATHTWYWLSSLSHGHLQEFPFPRFCSSPVFFLTILLFLLFRSHFLPLSSLFSNLYIPLPSFSFGPISFFLSVNILFYYFFLFFSPKDKRERPTFSLSLQPIILFKLCSLNHTTITDNTYSLSLFY